MLRISERRRHSSKKRRLIRQHQDAYRRLTLAAMKDLTGLTAFQWLTADNPNPDPKTNWTNWAKNVMLNTRARYLHALNLTKEDYVGSDKDVSASLSAALVQIERFVQN